MKGSVRPLSDVISQADAERVEKHVQEAVARLREQVKVLEGFAGENAELGKVVEQLPDCVSHQVMVPFGKEAFFPGRLLHTNEFLVLLGERYYAERSAKQTAEFLRRRGQHLDLRLADLEAQIADLHAEASFVRNTAEEGAAGVVEIREEYVEQARPREVLQDVAAGGGGGGGGGVDEDEEHQRVMARLEELEAEEAAAGEGFEEEEESEDEDEGWIEEFLNPSSRSRMPPSWHVDVAGGQDDVDPVAAEAPKGILRGKVGRQASAGRHVTFSDTVLEQKVVENEDAGVMPKVEMAEVEEYRKKGEVSQAVHVTIPRLMQPLHHDQGSASEPEDAEPGPPPRRFAPNSSPFPGARRAFTGTVVERSDAAVYAPVQQQDQPVSLDERKRPVSRFRKRMESS